MAHRSPQPRSTSPATAPGRTMAAAAASADSYASGNSAAPPTAFNEANSSKAMASRAVVATALLRLLAFSWHQCTASHSSSARPTSIRVSMGSQAFMSLTWRVLACVANPARRMTRDANQPPGRSHGSPMATRAAAWGAFFAFLARAQEHALKRAPPSDEDPGRYMKIYTFPP